MPTWSWGFFEQRALGFRRRPIDFIGQHQLGKDRSSLESELARFAVIDRHAEHIGGQEVAGELHALERQSQGLGDRMREGGFADPRNVFDQQVSARQQTRQTQANLLLLAQNHPIDLSENRVDFGLCCVHWPLSASTRAICAAS